MRDLPTGTITLLFTDIEGSTQLLQKLGERYGELLTRAVHCCEAFSRGIKVTRSIRRGMPFLLSLPAPAMGSQPRWLRNAQSPPIPGRKV